MRLLRSLLCLLLLSSCSMSYITFKTDPQGASVYLIPREIWNSDSVHLTAPAEMSDYILKEGTTPVHTANYAPGDYVLFFVKEGKQKRLNVHFSKPKGKSADVIETSLD